MRDDQPDETDDPRERDRRCREQRRRPEQEPLRARDVDADRARDRRPQAQRVQRRHRREREGDADRRVRSSPQELTPAAPRERAGQPGEDGIGAVAREPEQEECDERGEERRQRNAGGDQALRVKAATSSAVPSPAAKPSGGKNGDATPSTTAIAIAAPAPALTPVRNGSTSGLRSIPCNKKPATASATPTHAAMATRGRRNDHTIAFASPLACG